MTGEPAISVEGVRKSFEHGRIPALQEISFRVERGEFVALTGASGSGKSTILNLVGALDRPDAGSIVVDGRRLETIRDATEYRATTVGFVFQIHNLLPTLTASENVQIPMLGRRGRREREAHAALLLGEVGLEHRLDARPAVLSGGERQRVAIARALANDPRVLLADEPTGSLDSVTGMQVVELLKAMRDQHRMTILMVTNDDEIAGLADRSLRLRDGIIHAGAPRSAPA